MVMGSGALIRSAKVVISAFNIDGVCYAVKLLRADKLMLCLRHGVIMLGTESVISEAIKLKLCSFRTVIVCLLSKCTLWLMRISCFDYTCYLRIKVLSLRLLFAKRLLRVIGSSLVFCSICANLTLLTSSVFCARCHNTFCCNSIRFIKKIM